MIIGIDISSIPYGTGVSNYTINLVRHLLKIDKINQYKLLFYSLRQSLPPEIKTLSKQTNVKLYHYHLPPSLITFFWNQLHWLPVELFIGKCNIFHTWDWNQPPTFKSRTVTTIHDFVPILYPESQHPKTVSNFATKMALSQKECSHFICVSKNTQNDLFKLYPQISHQLSSVIYEAAENKYDQFLRLNKTEKLQKINAIHHQYDLKNYVLSQGTREPRKNLGRLIKAFIRYKKHFPKSKIELAISGKYGWGQDIDHLKNPYIKILGYIPEKDLPALHAGATILAYPSIYEGFGLPVIKSMKVGIPVLTSSTSCLGEIAGNAAVLINPQSTQSIYLGLTKILNHSTIRRNLAKKGLIQSKKFSWIKTATDTLKLYNQLYDNRD
jgi:glycosyltransferase involved in cell wall biosynthesis